ncbi:hypothetical protein JOC95_003829 [Bacillus tianshenii]|uniref:Transposase n=1 Tax=Sutcliffiella tianshenii TaxID=1463404 RepID=A0ABS2P4Y9_9BACI|nr:hypothetical protein [Bacillus tianshenii]
MMKKHMVLNEHIIINIDVAEENSGKRKYDQRKQNKS